MFPSSLGEGLRPNGVSVGELGNKFRKAREKKNLSLEDVSNVTKISKRMLQAIEEERFDRLPGGVFNKGFIRTYAKHLGLNDEEAVADYLACMRQAQIETREVWEPERPGQRHTSAPEKPRSVESNKHEPNKTAAKTQPPAQVEELPELQLPRAQDVRPRRREFAQPSESAIPWRLLVVAAVVIVLGAIVWTRRAHRTNTAVSTATIQTTQSAPVPVPAVTNPPSASNAQPAQHSAPAAARRPAVVAPVSALAAQTESDSEDRSNVATVQTLPKPTSAPSEQSTARLTLVIRATETSWISVLADGQAAGQETLIAPAHTSVRANREIVAKIGNAAGVSFLFNGLEIPAGGAEAEVKTFIFDSNGMRVVPPIPSPAQNN